MQVPSKWLSSVKPKGYFERRKAPSGETGEIQRNTDYYHTLYKSTTGVELEHRELPHEPSMKWPLKLLVVAVLLGLFFAVLWLYVKH